MAEIWAACCITCRGFMVGGYPIRVPGFNIWIHPFCPACILNAPFEDE